MRVLQELRLCGVLFLLSGVWAFGAERVYDVRDFGAKPDGKTLCTRAIQAAVDRCAADGGGTVELPPGTWLSGTVVLRSHVAVHLEAGSVLLGSSNPEDYPARVPGIRSYTDNYVRQSLIAGEGLENVAIRGRGTIDGQGARFPWPEFVNRPYAIRLVQCRDVLVEDLHLRNSAMWMQHYLACERVTLRGLRVVNHVSYNNDGLDIDACRDVVVSGCVIDSDDDALCLKSTLDRPCQNVTVSDCILSSHCNALKMGTESHGGFQNITITNCAIRPPSRQQGAFGDRRPLAGIALEIVDGGGLDRVTISNVVIEGVTSPLFLRLGNRARTFKEGMAPPGVGSLRNVVLSNIVATGASRTGCAITGLPGHRIENVTLRDVRLSFDGEGTRQEAAREIPEHPEKYPECAMFGPLPAYGLFCRHVQGLRLENVQLRTAKSDLRHALVCDDVEDAVIDGLDASSWPDAAAVIRATQPAGLLVTGCRVPAGVGTFLRLDGAATRQVGLLGNDLRQVRQIVELGPDVSKDEFAMEGNLTAESSPE